LPSSCASCPIRSGDPKACCEGVELVPLFLGHRVPHPLGGRGPGGEVVEQLLDVPRVRGEVLAVLRHERVELLLRVRAGPVRLEQVVEVAHHLADRGTVLVRRVLERLLHAREALVEHLAAEQVLDLLVLLPGRRALPVVVVELLDGRRRRRGEAVELHLGEGTVAVVEVGVARQLAPFGEHGLVEQLLDLLQGAVEVVLARQLTSTLRDPARQVVEAALVSPAAPQELPDGALGRRAAHDVLADGVERFGQIDRWRERVRTVLVLPVAGVAGESSVLPSHRRLRPRRTPC